MKRKVRQLIFEKFGGKCAYCGCELKKGWHVDEMLPVRRKYKHVKGHWRNKTTKEEVNILHATEQEIIDSNDWEWIDTKMVPDGCEHPERFNFDNQVPSCASCNINKHAGSVEDFRKWVAGYVVSLNRDSTQYKIAKRYGLIQEIEKPVVFHFETLKQGSNK